MQTHIIRKTRPGVVQTLNNGVYELKHVAGHHMQNRMVLPALESTSTGVGELQRFADKEYYTKWVTELSQRFKIGTFVTQKIYPFTPGRSSPPPWFRIHGFVEVRYLATWDSMYSQPKAVHLYVGATDREYMAAPAALRLMNPEEFNLAYAQYQEATKAGTLGADEETSLEDDLGVGWQFGS